jgi:hypothetical protein
MADIDRELAEEHRERNAELSALGVELARLVVKWTAFPPAISSHELLNKARALLKRAGE